MKNKLVVSETFYSVQCEGQCSGTPAVFLRLAGCNLLCKSDSWTCDTIEVWKHGTSFKFPEVLKEEYVKRLYAGAHLVITGGEPLLHQEALVAYLDWFYQTYKFYPIVEVETNATIEPSKRLCFYVHYWNVSFKLSNSGEPFEKRMNEVALKMFQNLTKVCYKPVIKHEGDVLEMLQDFGDLINLKRVWLMPAADTREDLEKVAPIVVELCKEHGFNYSHRVHISVWNKKTGV